MKNIWEKFKAHPWVGAVILFLLIALCISIASCVPDAKAEVYSNAVVTQAGDSVRVTVNFTLRTADSVRYSVSSTNGRPPIVRSTSVASGSLVFMLLGPLEGETDTISVAPTAFKRGLAFAQTIVKVIHTRGVTPPADVTDSVKVQEALLQSKVVQSLIVMVTSGDTCYGQWMDYHRTLLIGPVGVQSAICSSVFNSYDNPRSVGWQNARTLDAMAHGYPWTPVQDSIWRAES